MTPAELCAEYLKREKAANAPGEKGADCKALLSQLAEESGFSYEEARAIVLDHSFAGPC